MQRVCAASSDAISPAALKRVPRRFAHSGETWIISTFLKSSRNQCMLPPPRCVEVTPVAAYHPDSTLRGLPLVPQGQGLSPVEFLDPGPEVMYKVIHIIERMKRIGRRR